MHASYKRVFIGIIILIILIFGFLVRSYRLPTTLHYEMWDVTNSIRLHYLPLFNFQDTIRFNFFKSFLMGLHGIVDFAYWYIVSGVYNFLHIPISEYFIYLAQVFLGMFLIICLSLFAYFVFGKKLNIALFTMVLAALNLDHIMVMSRTHWHYNSEKLLELATYAIVFARAVSGRKILWDISLSAIMFVNALTPNVVLAPLVLLLQYLLYSEKNKASWLYSIKLFLKDLLSFRGIVIWVPYLFGLLIDYFVKKTIGASGIGMIGFVLRFYGFNPGHNIIKGLLEAQRQLSLSPDYFYNIVLMFGIIGGLFCLFAGELKDVSRKYLFFIFLLIYHFMKEIFFGRFYFYVFYIPLIILGGAGLGFTLDQIYARANKKKAVKIIYNSILALGVCLIFVISVDRVNLASRRDKGLNLIPLVRNFNDTAFDTFFNKVNPLKSVGYYLRRNSLKSDKIYTLFGGNAWTANCEYYFGKKAMRTESGFSKQIFNDSYGLKFYKERDGVDLFDFYVVIESFGFTDEYKNILKEAQERGVKKVADITYNGKIYASIYSAKNLPFETLRMEEYDRKWDKEYANLKNIYENKLVGLVSLWGLY